MSVSSILLIRKGDEESLELKKELWQYLKARDSFAYRKIRRSTLGHVMHLPGKSGRKASVLGYKIAQRLYGFN